MINLSVAISLGASENDGKQRKTRPEDIVAQYKTMLLEVEEKSDKTFDNITVADIENVVKTASSRVNPLCNT
jgi:hypothetical protein